MNLSREWVALLARPGWEVRRWNEVGSPNAEDPDIAAWAAQNGFIVLTQDLDFSDILFMTQAAAPSIILIRAAEEWAPGFRAHALRCIEEAERQLRTPSLLIIEPHRARWRTLPIGKDSDE